MSFVGFSWIFLSILTFYFYFVLFCVLLDLPFCVYFLCVYIHTNTYYKRRRSAQTLPTLYITVLEGDNKYNTKNSTHMESLYWFSSVGFCFFSAGPLLSYLTSRVLVYSFSFIISICTFLYIPTFQPHSLAYLIRTLTQRRCESRVHADDIIFFMGKIKMYQSIHKLGFGPAVWMTHTSYFLYFYRFHLLQSWFEDQKKNKPYNTLYPPRLLKTIGVVPPGRIYF